MTSKKSRPFKCATGYKTCAGFKTKAPEGTVFVCYLCAVLAEEVAAEKQKQQGSC